METKNLEIVLEFRNYKKIKSEKFTLSGSNLYLVQGKNDIGKSSITYAIRDLLQVSNSTPEPLTIGESSGEIIGQLPGPDGMYTIRMEFSPTGTRFTAVTPQNRPITKVTELRALLKYNSTSVNEFISLSKTADGRRKQREMLSALLSPEDQNRFNLLLSQVDTVNGTLFRNRKTSKANYETALAGLSMLDKPVEINTADIDIQIHNLDQQSKELESKMNTSTSMIFDVNNDINNIEIQIQNIPSEKDKIGREYNELKVKYEAIAKQMNELAFKHKEITNSELPLKESLAKAKEQKQSLENLVAPTKEKKAKIDEQIINLKISKGNTENIIAQNQKYVNQSNLVEQYKAAAIKDEDALTNARAELSLLSKKISSNITINDDGYVTIDNFLLDENQICKSQIMKAVASIMMKMNVCPIILMSDLESFDDESLDEFNRMAEENNFIIIGDRVSNDFNEITIVGYESNQ